MTKIETEKLPEQHRWGVVFDVDDYRLVVGLTDTQTDAEVISCAIKAREVELRRECQMSMFD